MRLGAIVGLALLAVGLAACVSPEEQRATDQQTCAGYGFQPGTDAFAHCMMKTAQQREAQEAANARQRAADQAAADRQKQAQAAQQARDAAAQTAQSHTATPPLVVPAIPTTPTIPTMPSNMVCTHAQAGNAGSVSCHSP